jgi:hypothetical protein
MATGSITCRRLPRNCPIRASHGTYSIQKVFITDRPTHVGRRQTEQETDMSHSNAIAKIASVTTLGLFTVALLMLALAPAPSLFAG